MTELKQHTVTSFAINAIKPFKFYVSLHLFVAIYSAIELSLTPYITKVLLDKISDTPKELILDAIMPLAIALVVIWWLNGAIWRICDFAWMKFTPRLKKKITVESMDYMMQHSFTFFQNNFAGSLVNKVRDLANCTQAIFEKVMYSFFNVVISLIIAFITLFAANKFFAFAMLVWALVFVLIAVKGGKTASDLGIPVADQQTKITGSLVDVLSNIGNVKLFSRRNFERKKIEDLQDEYTAISEKRNWFLLKFFSVSAIAFSAYYTFCILMLVRFYHLGLVTIGDFFLVFSINNWMIHLMWMAAQEYRNLLENVGTMNQALNFINEPLKINDVPDALELEVSKGEIIFENVDFIYEGKSHNIFSNKSVVIKSGQKVGLVGHSGSGKTTFVNLLLRLFDINSGRILVDNQDISKVTQSSLRSAIAMIPQDPSLFHRSLSENISYGREDATNDEIILAAKKSYADDFISQLPEKYDSLVGERGIKLSGGQRQRIAIARAFLKNAPILILDEATSALDSVTEEQIQNSLNNLMKDKTTLVVAHRLSTLRNMDRILVFDNGKIVEDGSHQELLHSNGIYKTLWESQVGGFIVDKDEIPSNSFSPIRDSSRLVSF
ncbi:MAG: ABC transporter ATP-binding protein/permease [Rickettsiales bacterium]|nr:ABC transporter ATP-binding protein/permease [Rickettsiales bacterium]